MAVIINKIVSVGAFQCTLSIIKALSYLFKSYKPEDYSCLVLYLNRGIKFINSPVNHIQ